MNLESAVTKSCSRKALTIFVSWLAFAALGRAADLFPFVLPWDDATPTITDLSGWNEARLRGGRALSW